MGRRPRLLLLVPLVTAAAISLGSGTDRSEAAPPRPAPLVGRVEATGHLQSPAPGWRVEHPDPGVYRVHLPSERLVLDVDGWDAAADVTLLPEGQGVTEVRFSQDGRPVDTAFDFLGLTV